MGYYALKFLFTQIYHKDWAAEYLPTPKIAKTLPLVLSRDEVRDVLAVIKNIKHRTVMMFIYSTGTRVSEIYKPQHYLFEVAGGKGSHLGVSAVREICQKARYQTPGIKKHRAYPDKHR